MTPGVISSVSTNIITLKSVPKPMGKSTCTKECQVYHGNSSHLCVAFRGLHFTFSQLLGILKAKNAKLHFPPPQKLVTPPSQGVLNLVVDRGIQKPAPLPNFCQLCSQTIPETAACETDRICSVHYLSGPSPTFFYYPKGANAEGSPK